MIELNKIGHVKGGRPFFKYFLINVGLTHLPLFGRAEPGPAKRFGQFLRYFLAVCLDVATLRLRPILGKCLELGSNA
ncbi:MAG: hypothetical protein COT91_01085 [Candidatus Doudnabacteria bacterium CG10_big_fil_rev_8_21_14_0_10_41_10]|uniref:Uncharacterized protein n=1 Tax=Candidatus Doudnabacteria bacterium CG10_big_fil_rev_8_21_14_0_10_41_10 TaxID=1974551 RepID=A0A2H0VED4_9BACT|nr:MAG: hypothetical protein COT91_01085 [Candidatus Doudnabacteria bacterium CG10_big_fil_rev_8_21_14_0_10_41_10]